MPRKDRNAKNAYQREWYKKHRERVIAKVTKRKWTSYAGQCVNCGRPTVGNTKGGASDYCASPGCASVQRKKMWEEGETFGHLRQDPDIKKFRTQAHGANAKRVMLKGKPVVMSIDELLDAHLKKPPLEPPERKMQTS